MSYEGLGTNGTTSTIRAVTVPAEVTRTELTEEERAQAEHDRTFVEDRIEEAGNVFRFNLRFLNPSTYSDPYAGLGLIAAAIVLAPAVIIGGYVGRKRGAMWKGAAASVGTVLGTAFVAKPAAIMITGRRNPFADGINAITPAAQRARIPGAVTLVVPMALSAGLGYLGSRAATRQEGLES